ncbi:serine hydrolase [Streptomyces pactum]|uniref:serine hydrolase n=1 Tax=Streptomyces pactum TaxID=68249 RepID=UPI0036FA7116
MTLSRRAAVTAAAGTLLAGAAATGPVAAAPATGGPLQRDADAVRDTGATGVLAEAQTTHHRAAVRSGVAALASGAPVPWDAYLRIGSDTKTFTATITLQLAGENRIRLTDTGPSP